MLDPIGPGRSPAEAVVLVAEEGHTVEAVAGMRPL
jgi:hypothetical protein